MRTLLLSLLLAAPARALLGFSSHKIVVVWVPAEGFSDWEELDRIFERFPGLRLTIGLTPESVTPTGRKVVARWIENGRLEAALRLSGDPILPLIVEQPAAPRPQDPPNRLAAERERFHEAFGASPQGFLPGGGAVDASVLAALKPMGFSWVAVGDYPASTSTWATAGGAALAPLRAAATLGRELTPESLSLPSYPQAAAFVVDEADGLVPEGSFLRLLAALADKRPSQAWATVSETAKERRTIPGPPGMPWPTWTGGTALWTGHPDSQRAWRLYADAARTLERYQNSGQADLKTLEAATDGLYAAQAARFYRGGGGEPVARELRARLVAVYRKLRQTPPESLFAPGLALADAPTSQGGDEEKTTDVHFSEGPSWFAFDNPAGTLARAPEGYPGSDVGLPPAELWRLKTFRVETSEEATTFVYRLTRLDNAAGAPTEMGSLLLQTYLDLNNVAGAGSTALLDGRGAFVQARDAWEYAVTASGWGAYLFRANPLGKPLPVGQLGLGADPKSGEVRVTIPRSYLRGNPARWGYVVLALAVDPASTRKPPAKPLDGAEGPVLGLLAPLEQQKAVLARDADAGRRRLAALRPRAQ